MITFCPRCGTRFREELKGEWFETAVRCGGCGVTVAEPPLLLARGPADDEVEYSLSEWDVPGRVLVTRGLADVDIPYRWEADLVLVVPTVAEAEVDLFLEELGDGDADDGVVDDDHEGETKDGAAATVDDEAADEDEDGDDGDDDGGEEAQAAMADLFVVADRLQHDPADVDLGTELSDLAAVVGSSAPPYGIERPVWRRIQGLAAAVARGLDEGGDDDVLAADARALRDFLRDLV